MNRYTKPFHVGITTSKQRKQKKSNKSKRKILNEPPHLMRYSVSGWWMDNDVQGLYLGGLYAGGVNPLGGWISTTFLKARDKKADNPFKQNA